MKSPNYQEIIKQSGSLAYMATDTLEGMERVTADLEDLCKLVENGLLTISEAIKAAKQL